MTLTPWFPASVKPVRVGVYNASADDPPNEDNMRYWDGVFWLLTAEPSSGPSAWQHRIRWRGLAANPNTKGEKQ